MRALRTIPMFRVIGEAVKKYAPSSWVINYTNPMMNIGVAEGRELFEEMLGNTAAYLPEWLVPKA